MIHGETVSRPSKEDLSNAIAQHLGLAAPAVSRGSSVDSTFLDRIHEAVAGVGSGGADTYRKAERLLLHLGRTYDPYWDTSESRGATGGGTVTVRAYSQILSAVTHSDRCFLVPVTADIDADVRFRYGSPAHRIGGTQPFNEAGPGSNIVYFRRAESDVALVASAQVRYIHSGWDGPWEAELTDYTEFATPINASEVSIPGWQSLLRITEITPATFQQIKREAELDKPSPDKAAETASVEAVQADSLGDDAEDPAGDVIAARINVDYPVERANPRVSVPDSLPRGHFTCGPARIPSYAETEEGITTTGLDRMPSRSRNPARDKMAEQRAVRFAIKALEADGWSFAYDRQKDGVGYDLEFTKASRCLKVEVKGIQGSRLAFNLTPKESWRAETDEEWVLLAVTRVLSPSDAHVHFVTRDRVVAAARVITGYRLAL